MGGDVSGDEAAWRDLIARYDLPVEVDPAHAPWPDAENVRSSPGSAAQLGTESASDRDPRAAEGRAASVGRPDGAGAHDPAARESGGAATDTAATDTAAPGPASPGTVPPGTASAGTASSGPAAAGAGATGAGATAADAPAAGTPAPGVGGGAP
ncbi:MAG: hypothetical protein ACLPUO_20580, partial [Streptosporangiaceae bacterium]